MGHPFFLPSFLCTVCGKSAHVLKGIEYLGTKEKKELVVLSILKVSNVNNFQSM